MAPVSWPVLSPFWYLAATRVNVALDVLSERRRPAFQLDDDDDAAVGFLNV